MYKKNKDFEKEIIEYLAEKGYVKKRQLVEDLMNIHKKESGYSEKSINRKLYGMKERGLISILKYKELEDLGIKESDKRSRYVIIKKIEEITEHIDTVIKKLSFNNVVIQKMALKEIENYKKIYALNPIQLDLLISLLDTEDIDLIDYILRIVYTYIDKKDIEPYNSQKAIEMLRSLLNRYPLPLSHNYKNLRTHFIFLLGHYNDYAVIDRLKKDAEELNNLHEMHDYESDYTAHVIEEHREELYEFEEKLRLEGKEEPAQFIAQTRVTAMIHLGMYDDPFEQNKASMEDF